MRRKAERGQIIPLVAITLTVMMGFSGMVVDNGYWQYTQRQTQTAADAAAIGGAQALQTAGCGSSSAATTAAIDDAQANGYKNSGDSSTGGSSSGVKVTVNNPPSGGPYSGNNCAVQVNITAPHPVFFSSLFGQKKMDISTSATALLVESSTTCCFSVPTPAPSGSTPGPSTGCQISGSVSAPGSNITCSGPITGCSGTVDAATFGYVGSANTAGCTFTGATPAPVPSAGATNPCPQIAGCATISASPPPTTSCTSLPNGNMNATLQPGCYSNFPVGSCGTVTLEPGTYVLTGTSDFSNTDFVGSGVTFYVTSTGTPPDFSSARSATISAPTTGSYADVLYYQVASNTGSPNFSGASVHFNGLIYAPGATNMAYSGDGGGKQTVIVASGLNLGTSGSTTTFTAPAAGTSIVSNVVLAQ